jgi:hypothetical protein
MLMPHLSFLIKLILFRFISPGFFFIILCIYVCMYVCMNVYIYTSKRYVKSKVEMITNTEKNTKRKDFYHKQEMVKRKGN